MANKIGVRVFPDTSRFRQDLKTTLDRIEKSTVGKIRIAPILDREALTRIQASLSRLSAKVTVNADVTRAAQRLAETARDRKSKIEAEVHESGSLDRINRLFQNRNIVVTAEADTGRAHRALTALTRAIRATVNADADIEKAKHDLDKLSDARKATINADADTVKAAASLAILQRSRIAEIIPKINMSAFAAAEATLASLSGGRALNNIRTGATNLIKNIDTLTPKVSGLAIAGAGLSAALISLTGSIFSLGAGLIAVAPAALALPGLFLGAAAGAGTLITVLADTGKYLGDLAPKFQELKNTMSGNFWSQAEAPLRHMVETLLPSLSTGLGEIALQFTDWARAADIAVSGNISSLDGIFRNVADAVNIAGEGFGNFIAGLIKISEIGAGALPSLAEGFNRFAEGFRDWANSDAAVQAFNAAIATARDLFRVLQQVVGIFAAVGSAAQEAGGTTLSGLADGLAAEPCLPSRGTKH